MFRKFKGLETDPQARRLAHMEDVFGRSRLNTRLPGSMQDEKSSFLKNDKLEFMDGVRVDIEREVAVDVTETRNRRNRGSGSEFFGALGHFKRGSASVGFGEQVEGELERRGYGRRRELTNMNSSLLANFDKYKKYLNKHCHLV